MIIDNSVLSFWDFLASLRYYCQFEGDLSWLGFTSRLYTSQRAEQGDTKGALRQFYIMEGTIQLVKTVHVFYGYEGALKSTIKVYNCLTESVFY